MIWNKGRSVGQKIKKFFNLCDHPIIDERYYSYGDCRYYEGDYWIFASSYYLHPEDIKKVIEKNKERIERYKIERETHLGIGDFPKDYLGYYGKSDICSKCEKWKSFDL